MLVEGDKAEDWRHSPSDIAALALNVDCSESLDRENSHYSWKFSPTDGIAMWKGSQVDTNKVFGIDSTGLYIAGKIDALAGGHIGGWTIGTNYLSYGKFADKDCCCISFASRHPFNVNSKYRLIIGHNFAVDKEGAIEASSGQIGGWSIGTDVLNSGTTYLYSKDQSGTGTVVGNSSALKTWRLKVDSNFGVTSGGKLYANNADIAGKITATSGAIGGWTINGFELTNYAGAKTESSVTGDPFYSDSFCM
jgi:hypothetical protein